MSGVPQKLPTVGRGGLSGDRWERRGEAGRTVVSWSIRGEEADKVSRTGQNLPCEPCQGEGPLIKTYWDAARPPGGRKCEGQGEELGEGCRPAGPPSRSPFRWLLLWLTPDKETLPWPLARTCHRPSQSTFSPHSHPGPTHP